MSFRFRRQNPALIIALSLALASCGSDGSSQSAPVATGTLSVHPSLGKIRDADVILTQLGSATPYATLNTGSGGAVTFTNLPVNLGAFTLEVKAGTGSTYFDEALGSFATFTGSLHMAGNYSGTSSVGVTPLTEAAYRRALTLGLTTANITAANNAFSQQFGVNITSAPHVVGDAATLASLQANTADAHALVLAAIAEAAKTALGAGEATPALKAALALAADAADGKIDGVGTGLPATLPYNLAAGYAAGLQSAVTDLITSLNLTGNFSSLIAPNDPSVPDPVDPGTPGGNATASGSITTSNANSPDFSPQADGFSVEVSAEKIIYTFIATSTGGNHDLSVETDLGDNIKALTYRDGNRLGSMKSLVCGSNYSKPCAGITITSVPASKSATITFADTSVTLRDSVTMTTETAIFNGSLTGTLPAGYALSTSDLPRSTDGTLNIDGSNNPVLSTDTSFSSHTIPAGLYTVTGIEMRTRNGKLSLSKTVNPAGSPTTTYSLIYTESGTSYLCQNCEAALAVTESGGFKQIKLQDAVMKAPLSSATITLNNTIIIGSTSGTLSSSQIPEGFTPLISSVYSKGDLLTYRFSGDNNAQTMTIELKQGTNTPAMISVQSGGKLYTCYETAQPILGTPACGGSITISTDRRTLTLGNISLNSGKFAGNSGLIITSATLTNQGL